MKFSLMLIGSLIFLYGSSAVALSHRVHGRYMQCFMDLEDYRSKNPPLSFARFSLKPHSPGAVPMNEDGYDKKGILVARPYQKMGSQQKGLLFYTPFR